MGSKFKVGDIVLIISGDSTIMAPHEAKGLVGRVTSIHEQYVVHTGVLVKGFDNWTFTEKCIIKVSNLTKLEKIIYGI